MKKYRIIYWLGPITTERYLRAASEEEALEKFKAMAGVHLKVVKVEEERENDRL